MLQQLSIFELAIYALVWALAGGIAGFYLHYSLNRNPRGGARVGVTDVAAVRDASRPWRLRGGDGDRGRDGNRGGDGDRGRDGGRGAKRRLCL